MVKSMIKALKIEWDQMIHKKMILMVMVLIPILVNFLLGYEFSKNQIQNIPMVIYDQDHSSLSRMISQQFRENEIFNVKYNVEDSMEMKKLLNQSKARVGMIIPKDFSKDILNGYSPTILMVYDGSHMSMASAAKSRATEILLTLRTGTFIKLIEGKLDLPDNVAQNIAFSIKFNNRMLYNPTKSFKNFLNPGFGAAIVQSGIAIMAAIAIRKEEIEKEKRKKIGYLIGKILFYSILGGIVLSICIYIQSNVFKVPFRGNFQDAVILSFLLSTAMSVFAIMISTWVKDEMLCTQINAILFVPNTVMVGYTWPVLSMPELYQKIAAMYPFYHYADNLRDIFLKGIDLQDMQKDITWFGTFILIVFCISLIGIFFYKVEDKKPSASKKEGESLVLP